MRMLRLALLWLVFCSPAFAQVGQIPGGISGSQFKVVSAGGCSQATTFLARTSGMSGTEITATTNLICGMVTDGDYAHLDGLYVFVTNTTTTGTLNWAQNAFNLSWTSLGTCTFVTDSGLTGDAAACFATTGFTPSTAGGHFAQNSATIGACILNSRTGAQNWVPIGVVGTAGVNYAYLEPLQGAGVTAYELQGGTFPAFTTANAQGAWTAQRTSSAGVTLYLNGTSVQTPTDTSAAFINQPFYVMAFNQASGVANQWTGDKVGYTFFGDGSISPSNIRARLATYIAALGGSGC